MHEAAYAPGRAGFGSWPKTKWPWGAMLASLPDVQPLKIHKGKLLLLSPEAAAAVDPLCRDALERAEDGELGTDAAAIVRHLEAAGPSLADEVRMELALEAGAFRAAREKLEREGAIVSRMQVRPGETEGHRHASTIARWDRSHPQRRKAPRAVALDDLVVIGIRAAVVVQEDEPASWFTWPIAHNTIRRLLEARRLVRPAAGWVAAA